MPCDARSGPGSRPRSLPPSAIGLALLLVFRTQDVVHPHGHARRRGALRGIGRGGHARCSRRRRLGVHRLRRVRQRLRGDAGRGAPRPPCDLARAAQRCSACHPQRLRGDARAPRPGRRRCGPRRRSRDDIGGDVVRLLVGEAVRGGRARGVPRLRDGRPGPHCADDLLDRARRRASCLAVPAARRPAQGTCRRHRHDHSSRHVSGCCWASTRPPSAA